jgi:hypothetical protein
VKLPVIEPSATLVHRIAARTAVTDIMSFGSSLGDDWYDVSKPSIPDEAQDLAESIAYLDLYGLLRRRTDGAIKFRFGRKFPGGKF